MADIEDLKTAKTEALESLLKATKKASDNSFSTSNAAAARDFALAYRYIQGGTQPGSPVVESK